MNEKLYIIIYNNKIIYILIINLKLRIYILFLIKKDGNLNKKFKKLNKFIN